MDGEFGAYVKDGDDRAIVTRKVAVRLWDASARFAPDAVVPSPVKRAQFVALAYLHFREIKPLLCTRGEGLLAQTVSYHPELIGLFLAPFIHADWTVEERISRFVDSVRTAEQLGPAFSFPPNLSINLMPLDAYMPELHLVLEKPKWFHREGVETLSLFRGNTRLMSLSFAFAQECGPLEALIGGIQGRKFDNALDIYREITKNLHGMRPRDLLIEVFRMICRAIGVTRILAISDVCRHHRSRFFGADQGRPLPIHYDQVWEDREGTIAEGGFYALPVSPPPRDLQTVSANKRPMYRRRYDMLEALEGQLRVALVNAVAVARPEAD